MDLACKELRELRIVQCWVHFLSAGFVSCAEHDTKHFRKVDLSLLEGLRCSVG